MHTSEHVQWTSSGWFSGTWTSSLWQLWRGNCCVTGCISFLERPRWKKQLYEWCKMTNRRERRGCLKGFWEGLDQWRWIKMTHYRTEQKAEYVYMVYLRLRCKQGGVMSNGWGPDEIICISTLQCLSSSFQTGSVAVALFLSFWFLGIDWENRCGNYDHITSPDRITVSIRVQSVWCLSCHTLWQD